jgi:acyl carrier protein
MDGAMSDIEADPDKVLETVSRLIREVIGDDGGLGPPITMATSFNEDLELESIEFVALAEKLQGHYGKGVDFAGWLSKMELHEILSLEVGQLVEHIVASR